MAEVRCRAAASVDFLGQNYRVRIGQTRYLVAAGR